MIVLTGAAGFIGSCMLQKLNLEGFDNLVLVDDFSRADKKQNVDGKQFRQKIHRDGFADWFELNAANVNAVIHLGARTDTTELSVEIFDRLNLHFSQEIWRICAENGIPLIYASSAATYGAGENGYDDDHSKIPFLKPLNPYGQSKQDFDEWILAQKSAPPAWAGFKFFNVYGPNEYHKGRMASVILHTARQIKSTGEMRLFRSHRPDFSDGGQSRDFIYVKDVVAVLFHFLQSFLSENRSNRAKNGIYNLGTGEARTFLSLATNTFLSLGLEPRISFIDTPADIRDTYQYFTEANMEKLRSAGGYAARFTPLEEGIEDYVGRFLKREICW